MNTQNPIVHRKRIGELLVEAGILRGEDLPIGLKEAQQRALRLGEVLVLLSYLSAQDLENALQAQSMLQDNSINEAEAVAALKCAAGQTISFQESVKQVKRSKSDKQAHYDLELALLAEKLRNLERDKGPVHRDVGGTCVALGDLQAEYGDASQAESSYLRALQIFERSFGRRHLRVAHCQAKLAELFTNQGRYKEAEMLYWYVLDTTQSAWGQDHIEVAHCHKALGHLLEAQSRLKEAEQFYLTSLRIIEKVSGPDSPDLTDGLRTLASFWRKQGKKPVRKRLGDLLVEAALLNADQLTQGLEYSHNNDCPLGQALVRLHYLTHEELRPALQAQLLIGDGVLPVQLATKALQLARKGVTFEEALQHLGFEPDRFTTDELLMLIETAEELLTAEATLGPQHAGVAVLSIKLADNYVLQKRFGEAEPLYKRSLIILEKSFGHADSEVAIALSKLAHLYIADESLALAEPLLLRALDINKKTKGKMHMDVAECLDNLGRLYEKQNNGAQAEQHYQASLTIKEEMLGASSERTKETLERLANALFIQSKFSDAEEIFLQLINDPEQRNASANLSHALIYQRLGEIHLARKNYAQAEERFQQALLVHEKIDRSSLSAAELMEKLSLALKASGKTEDSEKMLERAQMAKRLRS